MAQVAAYHRPDDLEEAIELLAGPDRAPLAGGTILNADRQPPAIEVVDLQALGLDGIEPIDGGDHLRLGAMVTLDRLVDDEAIPAWLGDLARAELPSSLRTVATVGGTIAAGGGESILLAGLLAAGADVERAGSVGRSSLAELLTAGLPAGALITGATIDPSGRLAMAATARTPADVPIVAALAHRTAGGDLTLALTGVADTPVLVRPDDPQVTLGGGSGIDPPGDFRGTAEYRRHLAGVLGARAVEDLA